MCHVLLSAAPPAPPQSFPPRAVSCVMWEPITNVVKGPAREQVCDDGGGESW